MSNHGPRSTTEHFSIDAMCARGHTRIGVLIESAPCGPWCSVVCDGKELRALLERKGIPIPTTAKFSLWNE